MTDDEAFVRAVVDHPGDETPRLVYADWLDDHDDPARAAYLRAEVEAVRAGDAAGLRERAAGLDAVWVARVSRPPAGVCCHRFRVDERFPPLAAGAFAAADRWPRVRLPDEYRAFLLNYGGVPVPDGQPIEVPGLPLTVHYFFPFVPGDVLRTPITLEYEVNRYWNKRLPALLEHKPADWEPGDGDWYHQFIPVAEADHADVNWRGDVVRKPATLMLGVDGEYRGRLQVIRWDWSAGSFGEAESDLLGPTLPGFLAKISAPTTEASHS